MGEPEVIDVTLDKEVNTIANDMEKVSWKKSTCLSPPPGFHPPVIENAVRDIPSFILSVHYLIIPKKNDDFNDDEEKMKVEYIRRLDNMLLQKQFFLEPAEVIGHNKFQRLNSGLPNDQEKIEWDMHWLNPSFHCVFFYWRQKEIQELMHQMEFEYCFFQQIFQEDQQFKASYNRLTAFISNTFFE